jgi:hypothetical protein
LLALELPLACFGIAAWSPFIVFSLYSFSFSFFLFYSSVGGGYMGGSVGVFVVPSVPSGIRPFSAGSVLASAGVPLFHRRPSAFVGFLVGFLVGFRRCLSAFVGFVGVIRPVCVFWPVFRASWPVFCWSRRRPSAFLGVIRLGISVLFGSAFRCFLAGARHFRPVFGVFYSAFVVLSSKPAFFLSAFCRRLSEFRRCFGDSFRRLFFPPVFIPVSVGVYIGVLVPRILLAGILLFRWFCASRPVFRCSVCVLPPVFFRRLSSAFVVILAGFRRCLLIGSAFRCFLSGFVPRVFKAGRLSVGFPPRRCYAADVPSAFR